MNGTGTAPQWQSTFSGEVRCMHDLRTAVPWSTAA